MNTVMVEHDDETGAGPVGVAPSDEATFRQLLINTLISGVTSSFLWFALTFWVYLETRSVVATGVIGGAFSLSAAFIGPAFGTFVDHHRKHRWLNAGLCQRELRPIEQRDDQEQHRAAKSRQRDRRPLGSALPLVEEPDQRGRERE